MKKNIKRKMKLIFLITTIIIASVIGIVEYEKITNIKQIAENKGKETVLKEQVIWNNENGKLGLETTAEKVTTNQITVELKNVQIEYESEQDLEYKYYIKKSNEVDYADKLNETGTEKSYTYTNLEPETNYDVKVEVINNKTQKQVEEELKRINTKQIPDAKEELKKGTIEVGEPTWNNNVATVEINTTIEGLEIEYQINTASEGGWTQGNTVTNLKNGDILRIRLTDGENKGKVGSVTIGEKQEISITKQKTTSNSIKVQIESNNKEYIKETGAEYSYYKKQTNEESYPTQPEYTGENSYTFRGLNPQTEYDIKVVITNKVGNKIEGELKQNETTEPTVADLIGKEASDENTYTEDIYGNKIVVPAGFIVVDNGDNYVQYDYDKENGESTGIPVVQDGIVIRHTVDGNEFVWVPVGTIKNNAEGTSTTTLKLGRYQNFTMDTSTSIPTPPEPKQEASKTEYDTTTVNDIIISNYFENSTGTYKGTQYKSTGNFDTLGKWIKNSINNGGYYIARYEASYGANGEADSKPSTGTPLNNRTSSPYTKTEGQLYNWVTQGDASTASKAMYQATENLGYYSELANSYAWDTAIIFIQTYSGNTAYASTQSAYKDEDTTTYDPANTGERGANVDIGSETTDKVCNIYDMASNIWEWTTEIYTSSNHPCVGRGGYFFGTSTTSIRFNDATDYSNFNIGFRSLLDCDDEKEDIILEGDITLGDITWNNETATVTLQTTTEYTIQYKIGENGNWTTGIEITDLKHGNTIYVRLTDGDNFGNEKSFDILDTTVPTATIELSDISTKAGQTITATVTHTDNESGINIANCKYVYNETSEMIGTTAVLWNTANLWTNVTSFSSNPQTVDLIAPAGGTYYLHVLTEDNAGNKTETISEEVTVLKTIEGDITSNCTWNNDGTATVTLETTTEYTIQYKIGEDGTWETGTEVEGLEHGDKLYVRLTDESEYGVEQVIDIKDTTVPSATISLNTTSTETEQEITATVTHTDNESGVNIANSKYIYNQTLEKIGTTSTQWETATIFNENPQTINLIAENPGTYYLHVLTLDNAGNKTETISEAVTVIKIIEGEVTADYIWNNDGTATAILQTTTEYTIQYKINENGTWETGTEVTNLNHGDTVFVRLTDGESFGETDTALNILDAADPSATISLSSNSTETEETITATVTHRDNESGINIANSKYVYNETSEMIGTESTSWDSATLFNENPQTISLTAENAGTYYLHVLTVDNAGNKIETVSNAVTVTKEPTVADLIGKTASDENIYTQDEYGNKIVVPADFIVLDHGESNVIYDYDKQGGASTNIPVVQDGIVIQDSEGNEFVWVPVGEIKNNTSGTSITTIKLGRYLNKNMDTSTTPPTAPTPGQEANKTTYDIPVVLTAVFENSTGTYNGITYGGARFKTLGEWISNTLDNGGYYIARYEASYGTDGKPNSKKSTGTPANSTYGWYVDSTNLPTMKEGQLWNCITQEQASTAAKAMYPYSTNANYYSELVNSYAWDTAIIFIQTYTEETAYASKQSVYTDFYSDDDTVFQPANTGERGSSETIGPNTTDKVCNIYDIASNCNEWSTEVTCANEEYPGTKRGGSFGGADGVAGTRGGAGIDDWECFLAFRTVLDCKSE